MTGTGDYPEWSALADFLSQMHVATLEESPLHELAKGSTDVLSDRTVTHGPWPALSCAAVLKVWHAAGWLGLYYRDPPPAWGVSSPEWRGRVGSDEALASVDAEDLLEHPERWVLERADGHVMLYQTDVGREQPWEQWRDRALDTATKLPLM